MPTIGHLWDPKPTPLLACHLSDMNARFIIYTKRWCKNFGCRVANPTIFFFTSNSAEQPFPRHDEEEAAMRMQLEWLLPRREGTAICTDSQSLLKATQSGSAGTSDLRNMAENCAGKTTLLWISSHYVMAS